MEWNVTDGKKRSGFIKRASLVLYVIDDFTNEKAKGGHVQVRMVNLGQRCGGAMIKKDDGYFVFIDLPEGDYQIFVGGDIYQEKMIDVHISANITNCPVMAVRLVPGGAYALPKMTACILGEGVPGHRIRTVLSPAAGQIKLLCDYSGGEIIRIFHAKMKSLEGRSFCIQDKEFFTVIQTLDSDERMYLMDRELNHTYKKTGTNLSLVTQTFTKKNGQFFIPVQCLGDSEIHCRINDMDGKRTREIKIKAGERIVVDLK